MQSKFLMATAFLVAAFNISLWAQTPPAQPGPPADAAPAPAQNPADHSLINTADSPVQFYAEAEGGFIKVFSNRYQSGEDGTSFNFVTQGGEEILFPLSRFELGMTIAQRHKLSVLYQPLAISTTVTFEEDVTVDGQTFDAGTAMELTYGFPFWRFTYGYDLLERDDVDVFVGAALQLRNASISFQPVNGGSAGSEATTSQNLGLVPALYAEGSYELPSGIRIGLEATGSYASSAFFNGADFEFEGSLLDTSLRISLPLKNGLATFVNLRYLGGGGSGYSEYEDKYWTQADADYSSNTLSTLSLTAGLEIR